MKNKCLLTNSINKFNNVGVNFLKKDDQFGESNTIIIENIISGIDKRDYYFQTRKINNTYICIVTKLIISDQTWNKFFGTLLNDLDINRFIKKLFFENSPSLLGLVGNNLPKYPEIQGLIIMGSEIYNSN
ncbi:MAG: hypothetical protein CMD07_00035 [Flavobacteriales bacterium]|nr:hypothetical protein [Flavobacteriales bacterium]|tara:strand:- start:980 stop:1369 length:390 start_codon:yes stop_codon:yes gene_type:complete